MMMGPVFELYSNYNASSRGRRSSEMNDVMENAKLNKEMPLKTSSSSSSLVLRRNESAESVKSIPGSPKIKRSASTHRCYRMKYIGSRFLDKNYTLPMLPWIVADIKLQANSRTSNSGTNVNLEVTDNAVKVTNQNDKSLLLLHPLQHISKFTQTSHDKTLFFYLFRDNADSLFTIHTFQGQDENSVLELFTIMRELIKEVLNNLPGHGLQRSRSGSGLETILTYSHQFEVMYIGSIRVSQKRAHPKVIDEAVEKFYELEKQCEETNENDEFKSRHSSGSSVNSLPNIPDSNEQIDSEGEVTKDNDEKNTLKEPKYVEIRVSPKRKFFVQPVIEEGNEKIEKVSPSAVLSNELVSRLRLPTTLIPNTQSLDTDSGAALLKELNDYQRRTSVLLDSPDHSAVERKRSMSGDTNESMQKQTSLPFGRSRLGSGGSLDFGRRRNFRYQNKTLLFLIGRLELCLISTDKHKIVLHKTFSNISHCSSGNTNPDHFGLICREPTVNTTESYVIHVFKCQTEKLVSELMHSLKQAFSNAYQSSKSKSIQICNTCPMNLFNRICCDVEGLSDDNAHAIIVSRIDALSGRDREEIMMKCHSIKMNSVHEHNELYMILLKELFECKQKKHSHTCGGVEKGIIEKRMDMIKEKAKSSISNTFEQLFKPKLLIRVKHEPMIRQRSATIEGENLSRTESTESVTSPHSPGTAPSTDESVFEEPSPRPRSNTLSGIKDISLESNAKCPIRSESLTVHQNLPSKSPLLNIFMKVGSQSKLPTMNICDDYPQSNDRNARNGSSSSGSASWRQSIFNSVSSKTNYNNKLIAKGMDKGMISKSYEMNDIPKRKTREELRELWKLAIKQQIMLNKMDSENTKLKVNQSVASDKRMKLDYDEIPNFSDATKLWDATKIWDHLMHEHTQNPNLELSENQLKHAICLGVPRHKRGEIWKFLAQQIKDANIVECPHMNTPYRELLGQLTNQQHAILVDLGRTFPKVPFYAQPLGPGQLSLYNLLKAYSLFDTEVEYCQGLSFVAGILLLHMNEDDAFEMIKHLLFHRGLRKQYKPEMDALQMQLYQLTRLLYDRHHAIYQHFEHHDISPTLYAAPWFLTLFASQFPLGFVSRLFDIIFVYGIEAIFRLALALLMTHGDALLQCHSFESIMDYLKTALPSMDITQMEQVFNQVLATDIKKQLDAYEVEYRVIQEEMQFASTKASVKSGKSRDESMTMKGSDREKQLECANKDLRSENMELSEQIHVHHSTIHQLESSCDNYLSTIKRLETRVRSLEDERDALMHSVKSLQRRNEKLENSVSLLSSTGVASSDPRKIDDGCDKSGGGRNSFGQHTPTFNISIEADENGERELEDEDTDYEDEDANHKHDSDSDNCHNRTQSDASVLSI